MTDLVGRIRGAWAVLTGRAVAIRPIQVFHPDHGQTTNHPTSHIEWVPFR